MADIKKIKVGGTTYDIKDATAARSNHTHSFDTITNRGEAFLSWGGKNFSGSYGPIDAAMVPELGANRLAFMPANAVTIEYSRDGGSTWTDYGPTDSQKIDLFNGRGASFTIGKATSGEGNIATNKYQLRVNIYTSAGQVYTALNKFVIYLSTSGTNNNWCTIRARKQSDYTAGNDTWTTFADKISVSGWSGYNVINTSGITTYGNTASKQYGHIQFIFGCDTGSTNNSYAGLNISKIFGFGGVGWTTPSTMAKTGQIYTYDSSQNVTFPAGISAKSFTENGTSLANKYLGKTAKAADADKLDGNDSTYYLNYNNLTNKPTIPTVPTALKNPNSITFKAGSETVLSYDGSAAKTFTIAASTTNGAFTISDGTTTKTVQLAGKFTDNNTTYSAGTGLQLSDTTFSAKLNSTTSLGTIGSTSKLYAVGVDENGKLCVNVPWTDTDTNTHNSHAIISGTKSDNSTQIKGSASSGDITLGDSGVTAGTYRSVTVNSKGIVVAGSSTDADTNTWRKIQLDGTDKLGTGTNTNPLNIKAGSNMTITESNGTFTFAATAIKTLKTDNTTAQTTSASEAIAGSGTINLHKVAKTGSYSDLNDKPTIPDISNLVPYTGAANDVNLGNHSLLISDQTAISGPIIKISGKSKTENDTSITIKSTGIEFAGSTAIKALLVRGALSITDNIYTGIVNKDGFTVQFKDDPDGDGKFSTHSSKYEYGGITHNHKKILLPEKEGTIALTNDLSTLLDKGTSSTTAVNQVVYNPVEMTKNLILPSFNSPKITIAGNEVLRFSLGCTVGSNNFYAPTLTLNSYPVGATTTNDLSTTTISQNAGSFSIDCRAGGYLGYISWSKDTGWCINDDPILTDGDISTQQWKLTSTSGTVTTVNICTK